ncbi:MAG: alpha/beta fold hydrolase [Desulfuromonadales bacterium]|nr:alpha/beta fold hydrolase [Desulfuromonadales bacterium]
MLTFLCILIFLLKLIVGLVCLTVLLSFTMAWYERANNQPELIERRFTSRGICLSLWLMIQESASLLLTLALNPFGWSNPKTTFLEPGENPPVILLHGLFQNRSCLYWMQYRLKRAGFKNVLSINTPPWRDMETLTEILARKIDEVRIAHKVEKVHLVGHSMGGMIARNYVQLRGGAPRVACCITLGSPHTGSKLAPFALSQLGKSLLPGSNFLKQINAADKPTESRMIAIYTRHDNIVLPATNARLATADEIIELDGMGHTALMFHPRAIRTIIDQLKTDETNDDTQPAVPANQ